MPAIITAIMPRESCPRGLIVGHEGKILFTHSGRSQTDLPEDCVAIRELAREVVHTKAADQRRTSHHCSDETLTLPDLTSAGMMWTTTSKPRENILYFRWTL